MSVNEEKLTAALELAKGLHLKKFIKGENLSDQEEAFIVLAMAYSEASRGLESAADGVRVAHEAIQKALSKKKDDDA